MKENIESSKILYLLKWEFLNMSNAKALCICVLHNEKKKSFWTYLNNFKTPNPMGIFPMFILHLLFQMDVVKMQKQ